MTKEVKYYFGIPFEVRSSAGAVADAAAAEPKFKVGDRVRVVKLGDEDGGSCHGRKIGEAFELKRWNGSFWATKNGPDFYEHEIELAPPFAVGDRVKLKRNTNTHAVGDEGEVYDLHGDFASVEMDPYGVYSVFPAEALEKVAADCAERKEQREYKISLPPSTNLTDVWVNGRLYSAKIDQPAIVALVKNGQPRPADRPYVHESVEAATTEAERLARNNPGQEFAVYQRVCARVAEVQYNMKEVA